MYPPSSAQDLQRPDDQGPGEDGHQGGGEEAGGRGRDVVSQEHVAEVHLEGAAPHRHPGHVGPLHARRQTELDILACIQENTVLGSVTEKILAYASISLFTAFYFCCYKVYLLLLLLLDY